MLGLFVSFAMAALPPDAQLLLSQFPEKALSLPTVIGRAIGISDSYKIVESAKESVDVARLQADAALDTVATLSGGFSRDRYQYLSGFGTTDNLTENLTLNVTKAFSTGTALSFDFNYQFYNPTYASALAASFPNLYWEPKASLSLTQNLWQDALGSGTRAGLEAGRLSAQAARLNYDESIENWFLDLVGVYYAAWLSQAQLRAATGAYTRKDKLVNVTASRARSGSADEADALQAQTGRANAEVQRNSSAQDLGDKWRGLVISLKLPTHWLKIDPAEIPMILDDPMTDAGKACVAEERPPDTLNVRKHRLLAEAAQQSLKKADMDFMPDFEVGLSVGANAQNTNASTGISDFFSLQHPKWAVTAKFKIPFEFSAEKSRYQMAAAEAIRADAASSQAAGNFEMDWLNACENFKQLDRSNKSLKAANEIQKRRLALDDRRFRVGRISVLQVLLTDDEATATESSLNANEVSLRLAAWKVLRLRGKYPEKIAEIRDIGNKLKL